ncbi:hypothetical protein ACQCX5_03780 [Propionibacteriaceae bacterium G57]|uniref:hypothetical protein n=1 Tax=Aestuariimicrobium sp. G57 TaxID=3418485 RepID=UPI003DA700D9
MDLVWTSNDGISLLVASPEAVKQQQRVVHALYSATTWAEFRELLPAEELDEHPDFEEMFEEYDEHEEFDAEQVWVVVDGDYPLPWSTAWNG